MRALELLLRGRPVALDESVDALVEGLGELLVRGLRAVDVDELRVHLQPQIGAVVRVDAEGLDAALEGDMVDEADADLDVVVLEKDLEWNTTLMA